MSTSIRTASAASGTRPAAEATGAAAGAADDRRRRAIRIATAVTLGSFVVLVVLLVRGHTADKEVWAIAAAVAALLAGASSVAYLAHSRRARWGRRALYALWVTVAVLGVVGANSHRIALSADAADTRQRPPLVPLVFTGLGIAGVVALRTGTKED